MLPSKNPSKTAHLSPTSLQSLENFHQIKVIGQGQSSKVLLVQHLTSKRLYALKVIKKAFLLNESENPSFSFSLKNQRNILAKLDHPFLIKLYSAFQNQQKIFLLLEYCPGGQLFSLQARMKFKRFSEENHCKFYASQLVLALEYLHKNKIIYRDLKAENVVIDKRGFVKLTDFGLSKILQEQSFPNKNRTNSICGTPEFLAPQIVRKKSYGKDIDWWCFGCLLCEMITGSPPFIQETGQQDRFKLFKRIAEQDFQLPKNIKISQELSDLIKKLLIKDPKKRLGHETGADQIKKHPWFSDVDFNELMSLGSGKICSNTKGMTHSLTRNGKVKSFSNFKIPFVPSLKTSTDTVYFDKEFTLMKIRSVQELFDKFDNFSRKEDHIKVSASDSPLKKSQKELTYENKDTLFEGFEFSREERFNKENLNKKS